MINDQIMSALDLLKQIEIQLSDDIKSTTLSSKKGNTGGIIRESQKIIRNRRRSAGHLTMSHMINLSKNDTNQALLTQLAQLNESVNYDDMTNQQQIMNLPTLLKKNNFNNDQTMNTEYEFVNLMKDSKIGGDESFFKSIANMDKGEAPTAHKSQES